MNQRKVPNENIEYIPREIPDVFFVLIVFIACGRNEDVVDIAARSPIIVVMLICDYFFKLLNVKNTLFNSRYYSFCCCWCLQTAIHTFATLKFIKMRKKCEILFSHFYKILLKNIYDFQAAQKSSSEAGKD